MLSAQEPQRAPSGLDKQAFSDENAGSVHAASAMPCESLAESPLSEKICETNNYDGLAAAPAQAAPDAVPPPAGADDPDGEEPVTYWEDANLQCGGDAGAEAFHPADRAEQIESMPLEKQVCVVRHLPTEVAADALAELDDEDAGEILENLDADDAARILAAMDPDDAVDVLDEVDEDHVDVLLSNMPQEEALELRALMTFDPETAAGVMNTEIILINKDLTVDEAISQIRSELEEKEMPYYLYAVDDLDVLTGVVSLRELMLAKPGTRISDLMSRHELISVPFDMDQSEVARLLSHYNFLSLPVVDREGHLMGMVTHDDVIDILQDDASSDLLGMVGAGQDEDIYTPWTESFKLRLPWLFINMLASSFSAFIVYLFDGSIASMALLAVLMPIVANQSGNTGQQALAVMIRQLATEKFDRKKSWMAVWREVRIGLATGSVMAVAAGLGAWAVGKDPALGMVMGAALLLDMLLGATAGGSIPLVLRSLGRDPAQASSIFLTALTDSGGFFIFLGLATMFLL